MSPLGLNLQKPRFEFKYILDLERAKWMENQMKGNVIEDAEGPKGYYVNSLYYDTDFHKSYFEKLDGVDPRYKLRFRWYSDLKNREEVGRSPVFAELKHRRDQKVYKDRVKVNHLLGALRDNCPLKLRLSECVKDEFLLPARIIDRVVSNYVWLPKGVVRYFRRAYLSKSDPSLRITFDTKITAGSATNLENLNEENGIPCLPAGNCVMEIKFHFAMPLWLLSICREGGLQSRRYSKYCTAVERLYPKIARRDLRLQEMGV